MSSETKLASIYIIDGAEEADSGDDEDNVPGLVDNLVHMTPQVSIVIQKDSKVVGTVLNGLRKLVVKAILTDTTLQTLAGSTSRRENGNIRYRGLTPQFDEARQIIGQMNLQFRISYTFDPNDDAVDLRESILARTVAVCAAVPGIVSAERNAVGN